MVGQTATDSDSPSALIMFKPIKDADKGLPTDFNNYQSVFPVRG